MSTSSFWDDPEEKKLLKELIENILKILKAQEALEDEDFEAYALRLRTNLYSEQEYKTNFIKGYSILLETLNHPNS